MGKEFPAHITVREIYEPAMRITDQRSADEYFQRLVRHHMSFGFTRKEAVAVEKYNLNYFAGFYDEATCARVRLLFGCMEEVPLAYCAGCRRRMSLDGRRPQYWYCRHCPAVVRRQGQSRECTPRQHLVSCVGCRGRMGRIGSGRGDHSFYCPRCRWSVQAEYRARPHIAEAALPDWVKAHLPQDLSRELREEVAVDILVALLEGRRKGSGYGLRPSRLDRKSVQRFIRTAKRRRPDNYKHVSLEAGEYPLLERLIG